MIKINPIIAIITVIAFLGCQLPTSVMAADEPVTPSTSVITLKKDDVAPFAGTLFSTPAAAELLARLENQEAVFKLRLEKERSLLTSGLQLKIDILTLTIKNEKELNQKITIIKDHQISELEELARGPAWYEAPEFWLAIGILSGIALTVGAGYAVGQAGR